MFWIVMADEATTRISYRHDSEASARYEAERLARATGKRFYVLVVVGAARPAEPPIAWTTADELLLTDLPF